MNWTRTVLCLAVAVHVTALPALAQQPGSHPSRADSLIPDSLIPDSRLLVRSDLYVLAGFVGATIAMFPLDRRLAESVRRDHLIESRALNRIEDALNVVPV